MVRAVFKRMLSVSLVVCMMLNFSALSSAQAQQIEKKPYQAPVIPVRYKIQIPFYVVGGVLAVAGTGVIAVATTFAKPGSKLAHLGGWGFVATTGGLSVMVVGALLGVIDFDRITPQMLLTKFSRQGEKVKAIGTLDAVWSAMRRQCRIYQADPSSSAKVEIEGAASNFHVLKSLKTEKQQGDQLCRYIEAIHEQANDAKAKNLPYSTEMAEVIVGRKVSQNDDILFGNLFAMAGVQRTKR